MKKSITSIILALIATVTISAQKSYDFAVTSTIVGTDTTSVSLVAHVTETKYASGCKSFEILLSDDEGTIKHRYVVAGPRMKLYTFNDGTASILDQNFIHYTFYRRKNGTYTFLKEERINNDYSLQKLK